MERGKPAVNLARAILAAGGVAAGAIALLAVQAGSASTRSDAVRPLVAAAPAAPPIRVDPAVLAGKLPAAASAPRRVLPAPGSPATPAPAAVAPSPAPQPFVVQRILPIDGPMRHGEWHWDDAGVPAGRLVVTVDTRAQVISVFRGGYEIGAAVILFGSDAKPTPTGVYPILQKKRHHVSNLYNAPMPYMQRLTNDGVAIHTSAVRVGYATHGCIGVPDAFAARLFAATKLGDTVIVTNGETLKLGDAITAAR